MSTEQNINLIELQSNELVQYSNKFKVISKYNNKNYESNEVELINSALEGMELKINEIIKDGTDVTLKVELTSVIEGLEYFYDWVVYKEDGETQLSHGRSTDTTQIHIEDLDDLEQFCLVQVIAYATVNGEKRFVASSDIVTIYKDTEDINAPITVDLTNDHAIIPFDLVSSETQTDADLFQELTFTQLRVFRGDTDITSECGIEWKASSDNINFTKILDVHNKPTRIYITEMPADITFGTITATITHSALEEPTTIIYTITRVSEGVTFYRLMLPEPVVNITYNKPTENLVYKYKVQKLTGRSVTLLSKGDLDKEGLEVAWGYKEEVEADLEGYTWTTANEEINYQIGSHSGLHIVLRQTGDNNSANFYDSEVVSFVKDGGVFTDLILSASSQVFKLDENFESTPEEIVITAFLHGELEGAAVTWNGNGTSFEEDGLKKFKVSAADMETNNSLIVTATATVDGEDYSDSITIYKLKDGSSALTGFLTNQCINFSANANGTVNWQDNNSHTSKIKLFRGTQDISDLISSVNTPSSIPEGMTVEVIDIEDTIEGVIKTVKQINIGIDGSDPNLGSTSSCDGQLEFVVHFTGSKATIPLVLSWSKNNAGQDGDAYTNLQLTAPTEVFIKNPNNGDIDPKTTTLTAKLYGDLKGKENEITWYKDGQLLTGITGTTLSLSETDAFSGHLTETTYKAAIGDWDDEFSFYLLTEGEDAYAAWLSDQSWSFSGDKDGYVNSGVEKTTTVKIYKGGKEITSGISIDSSTAGDSILANGGSFSTNAATLTFTTTGEANNLGGAKNADGTINIRAKLEDKYFDLVLSWDKNSTGDTGAAGTSPYIIALDNDSATIGTDKDGGSISDDALRAATETTAQVWLGEDDITDECSFNWTASGCILSTTTGETVYLTAINDGADTATATVAVTHGDIPVGNKTLTVTKNKQGETGAAAVTYVLSVTPNSWNNTGGTTVTPEFTVIKYEGSEVKPMSSGYVIKVGDNQYDGSHINSTTTFDLYIGDDIKVDSETVTAVQNGESIIGPEGPTGPGIISEVRVYQWSQEMPDSNSTTWLDIDDIALYDSSKKNLYLWMCYKQTWNDDNKTETYTYPSIRLTDYEMGTLMASKEGISIATWCEKYGRTLIDGSTVATGSITAKQINTEGLSAEYIKSSNYIDTFEPPILPNIEGLVFTDKGSYYETAWDGKSQIETIVIPETYMGKPVSTIATEGFYDCPAKTIYLPTTITVIPEYACFASEYLTTLYLPRVFYIDDGFASNVDKLTTVIFLSGTELVKDYLTAGSVNGTLQVLGLPETLKTVQVGAFASMTALTTINFAGTEEEWNAIENIASASIPEGVTINYLKQGFKISSAEDDNMIDSAGFKVTHEGKIAAKSGMIGGWEISEDKISKNTISLYAGDEIKASSQINNKLSPVRISAGDQSAIVEEITCEGNQWQQEGNDFKFILNSNVEYDGHVTIANYTLKEATLFYTFSTGSSQQSDVTKNTIIDSIDLNDNMIQVIARISPYADLNTVWASVKLDIQFLPSLKFHLLEDGYLYAEAANISGKITATEGYIGGNETNKKGWAIQEGSIVSGKLGGDENGEGFHMYSAGKVDEADGSTTNPYLFGSEKAQEWMLGIGKNFGVTKGGQLYCAGGHIKGDLYPNVLYGEAVKLGFDKDLTCSYIDAANGGGEIAISPNTISHSSLAGIEFTTNADPDGILGASTVYSLYCTTDVGSNDDVIDFTFWWQDQNGVKVAQPIDQTYYFSCVPYNRKDEQLAGQNVSSTFDKNSFVDSTTGSPKSHTFWAKLPGTLNSGKYFYWALRKVNENGELLHYSKKTLYGDYGDESSTTVLIYSITEQVKPKVFIKGDLLPSWSGSAGDGTVGYSLGFSAAWKWADVWAARGHFDSIDGTTASYSLAYTSDAQSDERIKNSISSLPLQYEVFFDKIEPTRYKYNEGTSGRYHTGFIAQQLVSALEESELTTQDFAGVMLREPGTENECWYLRRDEFVALNTWQIQKLKARMKQAEDIIQQQAETIKKLEERLECIEQYLKK